MRNKYKSADQEIKHAIKNYNFNVVLKIADDALVIGENPEKQALQLFKEMSQLGIAGLHLRGQYPLDFVGTPL